MDKYRDCVRKYWYCFLLGPFFMVLEACGEFIVPAINANIIDVGAANGDIPYILRNGGIMALIALAMMATGVLGAFFSIRASVRLTASLRVQTFRKIQTFSFANIDTFTTGSLITRITNDMTQIQNFSQTLLRGMFRSPVMLIGALIMSFSLNPSLAWIIFVVTFFLAVGTTVIILIASPRYTRMQEALDDLNTNTSETIRNMRVIKSHASEGMEKGKFKAVNEILVEKSIAALKMMLLMQPMSALAVNVTTLLVVWVAGHQIMIGSMTIGELTAFITYLSQVLTALNFVANIVLQGTRAAASDRRISEVLNTVSDITDDQASMKDKDVKEGSIEFDHVTFRYFKNTREKVLDDISLQIRAGETVGIIGSTGSGKSTLISMISRLYDPDEGTVRVDGTDVRDYSLAALRESIAVVLQKNTLFSGTIAENLRWGKQDATDEEIVRASTLAQAHGFISSFPDGYETMLGQGGVNLSGGQKQRLCIARALLRQPKILILDDSTSAVDTATDAAIRKAFRDELPGMTKLIIAQRIASVRDADRVLVIDGGRVVGFDRPDTLLKTCEAYREIYLSQQDTEEDN